MPVLHTQECFASAHFDLTYPKAAIGMSAGIKGPALGTGPRGNYIHIGTQGALLSGLAERSTALATQHETNLRRINDSRGETI